MFTVKLHYNHGMQRGFSLVELSIVLVILGLLTGGILAGQSLIRAAELRAVSTEFGRYQAAGQAFRDKYFAIPGDMSNATRFWGRLNNNAWCVTNSSAAVATPGTCDGNGNGFVNSGTNASEASEEFMFWQQLALAGLIEGSYSGIAGSGAYHDATIGTNVPKSRISSGGWSMHAYDNTGGALNWPFLLNMGNSLVVGAKVSAAVPRGYTRGPIFTPGEAWNIDVKMDDGKPGYGKVVHDYLWSSCTTAAAQTDNTADYKLTSTTLDCSIRFRDVY